MSFARTVLASTAAAMALSACGTVNVKPSASSSAPAHSRGRVDDPRTSKANHVACLRADKLVVREIGINDLLVGSSVRVHFEPTPGAAQAQQITDAAQGAEVIGSALVYPGQASDGQLNEIEHCVAQGVSG